MSAAPPGPATTVLLVDDEHLVREGLRLIIDAQPDLQVVGEAADGEEAVRLAKELRPDVVVMDVRMPRRDGIAATRDLLSSAEWPVKVIVVTTFDLDDLVFEAMREGASGFLLKTSPPRFLPTAIREVVAGETMLSSQLTRRLIERNTAQTPAQVAPGAGLDLLTPRELDVLALLARGLSNTEIAASLVVSPATVKTHVIHILAKLGLRDRTQAAITAYERGLVRPGAD